MAQPLSQGWWGAGTPPQRPELYQLQMPNGLHQRSSRVSSLWQLLSLGHELCDWTALMGQDGHWTELLSLLPHTVPSSQERDPGHDVEGLLLSVLELAFLTSPEAAPLLDQSPEL